MQCRLIFVTQYSVNSDECLQAGTRIGSHFFSPALSLVKAHSRPSGNIIGWNFLWSKTQYFMNLLFFPCAIHTNTNLVSYSFSKFCCAFFFSFSYDLPLKEAQSLLLSSSTSLLRFFRRRLDLDLFCVF